MWWPPLAEGRSRHPTNYCNLAVLQPGSDGLSLKQFPLTMVTFWIRRLAQIRSRSVKPAPGSAEEVVMLWLLATPTVDTETKVRSNIALGAHSLLLPVSDPSPRHALSTSNIGRCGRRAFGSGLAVIHGKARNCSCDRATLRSWVWKGRHLQGDE